MSVCKGRNQNEDKPMEVIRMKKNVRRRIESAIYTAEAAAAILVVIVAVCALGYVIGSLM